MDTVGALMVDRYLYAHHRTFSLLQKTTVIQRREDGRLYCELPRGLSVPGRNGKPWIKKSKPVLWVPGKWGNTM